MTAPLVLLHGFTGSARSYERVLAQLGPRTAILPELVGHGAAGAAAVETFEDEVARLAAIVREAAPRPARLVGYSLGGRLALGLLAHDPGLFTDAALIGARAGLATEAERAERRRADEAWCRLLERDGIAAFVDAWQSQPLFSSQARLPRELLDAQRQERLAHSPSGLVQSLRTTGLGAMPDYSPALAGVHLPVRLLVGELDTKFRALARGLAELLPRAEVEVVAGSGHNVVLERPDVLAAVLGSAEAAA